MLISAPCSCASFSSSLWSLIVPVSNTRPSLLFPAFRLTDHASTIVSLTRSCLKGPTSACPVSSVPSLELDPRISSRPSASTRVIMSTAHVTRRRLSIGVPSFNTSSSVPRAPCSPITNDHPHPHVHTATKPPTAGSKTGALKKIRSFTSLLRPPSRSASPAPPKPKKEKRSVEGDADIAAAYGSSFAREVALLQMLDGGTTARNIERVHKARAKANGTYYSHGVESGAVRGPNGELFANAQEESERRGLVNGGYTRSRSKKHSQRHEEDEYATPDEEEPAWARFQPAHKKSRSTHTDARAHFFADSFAPPMPMPRRA
ncbi:hypothetical protein EXIGLDRAFT_839924 [Exidia glandulosa HHB12029]|uniref:Uncharacterized protein n=1 Tax=Exidia glandulosa HHB12029 TaxID=1314781 RepID=A0A165ERA7_EXIGL|nr:hypothetical protein EXIGLDRAFT_839924 [Exidia glandulosa HHB12029]